jgi:predicted kinase
MFASMGERCGVAEVDKLAEVLIVLSGLPGVGKTTIARAVAAELQAVHVRIDSIEHALRSAGWHVDSEGYRVAYAIAEDNLRLGRTVVADCVNPWPATRSEWNAVADRAAVRAIPIEVMCSDVDEHRRRVEARVADIAGHRLPAWADVIARDYRPWDVDRLVVDTARLNVQQSVQTILSAISA